MRLDYLSIIEWSLAPQQKTTTSCLLKKLWSSVISMDIG